MAKRKKKESMVKIKAKAKVDEPQYSWFHFPLLFKIFLLYITHDGC